jgi:hypothetical protein
LNAGFGVVVTNPATGICKDTAGTSVTSVTTYDWVAFTV